MPTSPPALGRVLLTNDDGVEAPGLAVLEEVAATLAREVWVVAPEHDQSGTSHSISLHAPLRISAKGERRFAVRGTPGDCVALALRHLTRDGPPELILSGVNRGANLGVETVFSGTVGAAMTGMLLGIPSIGLSQAYSDRAAVPWDTARALAPGVIRQLLTLGWSAGACLNVNFPDRPPAEAGPLTLTRQGLGYLQDVEVSSRTDPRGFEYQWLRLRNVPRQDSPGTEAAELAAGRVTVTPLRFERTDELAHAVLRDAMARE